MQATIIAIYENGILRPLAPLVLPEHTEVQISIIVPETVAESAHRRLVTEALAAAGLTVVEMRTPPTAPLSEEARSSLARSIAPGRPLSEIIIEERQAR